MRRIGKPLSHFVNDIPLRYKFLFIYLLCVLVPLLCINVLFYIQNSRNTLMRERENLQISLSRASYEVEQMVNQSINISNTLAVNRTLNEQMDARYSDQLAYYDMYDSSLREKLLQYTFMYPYISWLGIYTANPTMESGGSYMFIKYSDQQSEWYQKTSETSGKVVVTSYLDINPMNPSENMVYLSIIRKMDTFPDLMTYVRYMKIDLNLAKIRDFFANERNYLRFKLVDGEGRIVLDSTQSYFGRKGLLEVLTPEKLQEMSASGEVFESPLRIGDDNGGWRLIGVPERSIFTAEQVNVRRFFVRMTLVSTIIPTILIYIIFNSYNIRVRRLSKHMQMMKNERFEPIDMYEGRDELGRLLRSFNMMASKIRSLINDVYKLEIQKKDLELERVRAELNYLQSQVDPHFLFNTLNALLVVSKKHRYEHVTEIIRNLSQLLRRLLNWKNDLVTIEEELRFVEMYLQIEKFRFQERFHYEINAAPQTLGWRIPKLSIQSLAENACKHGLQFNKGERAIRIEVGEDMENLFIRVEDNGIGMSREKVDEILRLIHGDENGGKSTGLRNVYKRMNHYYSNRAVFVIDSREHIRTAVSVRIPLVLQQSVKEEAQGNV